MPRPVLDPGPLDAQSSALTIRPQCLPLYLKLYCCTGMDIFVLPLWANIKLRAGLCSTHAYILGVAYNMEGHADNFSLGVSFQKLEKKNVINTKVESEPDNLFDANAIGVLIDYGLGFKYVGYKVGYKFFHQLSNKVVFSTKTG